MSINSEKACKQKSSILRIWFPNYGKNLSLLNYF